MRLSSLVWGLLLGAVAHVAAQEEDEEEIPADYSQEYTDFDGKKVPPLLELTPDNFEKEIKGAKHLMVKHYRFVLLLCRAQPVGRIADET